MAALSERDFEGALAYVRVCEAAVDLPSYRRAVTGITEHVPGHLVSYNEVDLANGTVVSDLIGEEHLRFEDDFRVFAKYAHQHPVIAHINETGDLAPYAISDFIDAERLHSLDLYKRFYARMEVEDQIAFGLPSDPELVLGVAICRREVGFSERDRSFLALVAPHAGNAYLIARARTRVREALAGTAPEDGSFGVVVLDEGRRAEQVGNNARILLQRHLDEGGGTGLPAALESYLARDAGEPGGASASHLGPPVRLTEGDGRQLLVRLVRGALPGGREVLLLEERRDAIDTAELRTAGLSEREVEVVLLLVEGLSNPEIAARLLISPHTVKRHLESVYPKLGVSGRAETIARLLRRS